MAVTGKAWEEHFRKDWEKSFPEGFIIRLNDLMSGYKNVGNVCDFIGYVYPNIYLLECKAHKGASIPFEKIPQFERLIKYSGIKGVRSGIVLYLYEKYKVYYIPVKTIEQMKKDGKKSVGIKATEEGYNIIEIPSEKLRTFMNSDYNILRNLEEVN